MSPIVLTPGSEFAGRYTIVRKIAQGGMGAVYEVRQSSTDRTRALKVLLPTLVTDPRLVERFVQEARVGSKIASDHVVEVLDAGVEMSTHTPWLVMEMLEGETLAERVHRLTRLSLAETVEVLTQVCHALSRAHAAGIVHRDLKPENIFVANGRRSGASFTVKVLDFGIARWLGDGHNATQNSQIIGSPGWMAPEQFDAGSSIRAATDVWALGLIAYFLLTGRHYWRSLDSESPALMPVIAEISRGPVEPASTRAGFPLPAGFDAWFVRCLSLDATARFPDAGACLLAFSAGMTPEISTAIADTIASEPPLLLRQHTTARQRSGRATSAIVLATTTGLLMACGVVLWLTHTRNKPIVQPSNVGLMAADVTLVPSAPDAASISAHTPVLERSSSVQTATATTRLGLELRVEPRVVQLSLNPIGHGVCALIDDGSVRCWGEAIWRDSSGPAEDANEPMLIPGLTHVRQVSVGLFFVCAIAEDRSLQCWGSSSGSGALGRHEGDGRPGIQPADILGNVSSVSAGRLFTCAVTQRGNVMCSGDNSNLQLGDPTVEKSLIALPVAGPTHIQSVSAGSFGACALAQNSDVWCWGKRYATDELSYAPYVVPGVHAVQVTVGGSFACARTPESTVQCWGSNGTGALGDGSFRRTTAVVNVKGLTHVRDVNAGFDTACAVHDDGTVSCWGNSEHGLLFAAPSGDTTAVPVLVAGLSNVAKIHLGEDFACVLTREDRVLCWGKNQHGSLGIGTSGDRALPTPPRW